MTHINSDTVQLDIGIEGMTCGHCEKAVIKALMQLDPQAKVAVDRTQNKVEVDSAQSRDALANAIADEGYKVVN